MKILTLIALSIFSANFVSSSENRRSIHDISEEGENGEDEVNRDSLSTVQPSIRRRSDSEGSSFGFQGQTRRRIISQLSAPVDDENEEDINSLNVMEGNVTTTNRSNFSPAGNFDFNSQRETNEFIPFTQPSMVLNSSSNHIGDLSSNTLADLISLEGTNESIPFTQPDVEMTSPVNRFRAPARNSAARRYITLGETEGTATISGGNNAIRSRPSNVLTFFPNFRGAPIDPNQIVHQPPRSVSLFEISQSELPPPLMRCNAIGYNHNRLNLDGPGYQPQSYYDDPDLPQGIHPLMGLAFPFDVTDDLLMPFVSDLTLIDHKGEMPHYYGEYNDPETGESLIVPLPLDYSNLHFDSDDDASVSSSSASDSDDPNEMEIAQQNFDEPTLNVQTPLHSNTPTPFPDFDQPTLSIIENGQNELNQQSTLIHETPERGNPQTPIQNYSQQSSGNSSNNYRTPPVNINRRDVRCPVAPCGLGNADSQDSLNYVLGLETNRLSLCLEAERKFREAITRIPAEAERHAEFAIQDVIFGSITRYSDDAVKFDADHLRAFEIKYSSFFKLVQRCPQKYFVPALALSLQYDEDFPKFLSIFFKIKNLFHYDNSILQNIILELILNMPLISNAAFEFFSNPKNAVFVFDSYNSYPHFYGKLSSKSIAQALTDYTEKGNDYSMNPLRTWLLGFDFAAVINEHCTKKRFALEVFEILWKSRNLFTSDSAYILAHYRLFKTIPRSSISYFYYLQTSNLVRPVLRLALAERNLQIVKELFREFNLEYKTDRIEIIRQRNRNVEVSQINDFTCVVKIIDGKSKISLILPLPPM